MRSQGGFSLIELVIVVIILGLLGAIAIPRLSRGSEGARVSAFVSDLNTFASAIERYRIQTRNDVADAHSGTLPAELEGYIRQNSWEQGTPLGGMWDIEANDNGVVLALGVHYRSGGEDQSDLQQADDVFDDGNLKTGAFQKIGAGRYYLILEN